MREGAVRAGAPVRADAAPGDLGAVEPRRPAVRLALRAVRVEPGAAHPGRRAPGRGQRAVGPRVRRRACAARGRGAIRVPLRWGGDRRAVPRAVRGWRVEHGRRGGEQMSMVSTRHDLHARRVHRHGRFARRRRPRTLGAPPIHHRPRPQGHVALAQARVDRIPRALRHRHLRRVPGRVRRLQRRRRVRRIRRQPRRMERVQGPDTRQVRRVRRPAQGHERGRVGKVSAGAKGQRAGRGGRLGAGDHKERPRRRRRSRGGGFGGQAGRG